MTPTVEVFVRTRFEAFHRWLDAPESVAFLRNWHRHEFHVQLNKQVKELDREIEFITLKRELNDWIKELYQGQRFEKSCEMIAMELMKEFNATRVEVSEDGENGAVVTAPFPFVMEVGGGLTEEERLKVVEEMEQYSTGLRRFIPTQGMNPPKPVNAAEMFKNRPFIGVEAEGPGAQRDIKTLFIPGCCSLDVIRKAISNASKLGYTEQVYYGAGNILAAYVPALEEILKLTPEGKVTVEVSDYDPNSALGAVLDRAQGITVVSRMVGDYEKYGQHRARKAFYDKWIAGGVIFWKGGPNNIEYRTSINDPKFLEDRDLILA